MQGFPLAEIFSNLVGREPENSLVSAREADKKKARAKR
jgi:hypothetical protein